MYTVAGFDVYVSWVATGIVVSILISVINYLGVKPAAIFNTVLTFVILGVGIALIAAAAVNGNVETAQPFFDHGIKGLFSVAMMTPFMFVGFDVIPQASEEINISPRRIGLVLMVSIVIAIIFYIAVIIAVSLVLTKSELANSPLATADAMKKAFLNRDAAAKVLIIGGMAGILTSWNSFFVGGSRAIFAMAEAKMLPKALARLHKTHKTPVAAICLIGLVSCIAPFFGRAMLVWITNAGSFSVVIAYILVAISYLILRKNEPDMPRPYKIKFGGFVGVCAVLMGVFMAVLYLPGMPSGLGIQEWGILGFWTILGLVFCVSARIKYGSAFGMADGLLWPVKYRTGKTE
jgi:amino acid transporter